MAKITKTFSFKVPDDYTLQEASNDSSVSFTYHGPAYLKVQINPEGKLQGVEDITVDEWIAEGDEDGAVLVNATAQPLEASIIWQMRDSDMMDLPTRTKTGPDGLDYVYPWPLPPHKAYEPDAMTYSKELKSWQKPYPWHHPWTDWNMISNQANNVAADATAWLATDDVIADSDLTVKWTQIQTEAVNKLAAYSTAGLLPHEVTFRLTPHDSDEGVITAAAIAAAAALDSDEG
jgi:hypothetical protein|tara:strand:+ start:1411 stop:2109 length:699 start_codon:yes stop_codon:yes gene_type:complete